MTQEEIKQSIEQEAQLRYPINLGNGDHYKLSHKGFLYGAQFVLETLLPSILEEEKRKAFEAARKTDKNLNFIHFDFESYILHQIIKPIRYERSTIKKVCRVSGYAG